MLVREVADGRYQQAQLDGYPAPGKVGYLACEPHPNSGEDRVEVPGRPDVPADHWIRTRA
ncbi:MAG: hypothetical protein ACJ72D_22125 [Marmoricola sp.]